MATQDTFDFGDAEEANKKADADKARQKARDFYTSDPEYAKKVEQREEAKKQDERMREIVKEKAAKKAALAQSSMISPSGTTTAAGSGAAYAERPDNAYQKMADQQIQDSENRRAKLAELKARNASKGPSGGGGSGGMGTGKMNRDISKNMKSGGKVSSASKRADGCCVKGKTKGRMV
jgi:hypothetical protein